MSFRPGGLEADSTVGSTAAPSPAQAAQGMDIWWAIKMGLSSKVETFIAEADDSEAFVQQHDTVR